MNTNTLSDEKRISPDRKRTNLLRVPEQAVIAFLCRIMPPFISSDMLTFIGFLASLVIFFGFWLAKANLTIYPFPFLVLQRSGLAIRSMAV
jgi:hypothetical protein